MATQSLYRRYRPRRFSELRGQEHIVRALRNAVINEREGQAYLFSGPRGTGKTTSARILAKVLNCERPVDGEPCCECDSCIAVERGTSYDVHELDAASNNGVDAMRDLIEKASLGTPGRHKVYILDEVHMLSKQAEAALLKTLEEPPAHVVFVLATTDPQKVSDTIRSRTQHLRFHLLPMDELEAHVRWVIEDAGLTVSEASIQSVLEQGGGSARDTLSALELVASAGGDDIEAVQYGEFVEALIEHDPGRALTATAFAVHQGRDPRGLTEDLVRHLRDCFLSLMAPELVALPERKAEVVADQGQRLGAARVVRAMERLGEMLVEMRHAPDPRLLLEVALVQLTHEPAANDIGSLMSRLDRLEQAVGGGAGGGIASVSPGGLPTSTAAPGIDPSTGRVQLGGGARRDQAPVVGVAAVSSVPALPSTQAAAVSPTESTDAERAAAAWSTDVVPSLKPLVRAIFSVPRLLGVRDGALVLGVPNEPHRLRCEQYLPDVQAAVAAVIGTRIRVTVVIDGAPSRDDRDGGTGPADAGVARRDATPIPIVRPLTSTSRPATSGPGGPGGTGTSGLGTSRSASRAAFDDHPLDQRSSPGPFDGDDVAPVVELRPGGAPPQDEDIDLDDLVDAPPDSVVSPIDRLAQAFPGSELLDERR